MLSASVTNKFLIKTIDLIHQHDVRLGSDKNLNSVRSC
jgi:hypothetical protein